VTPGETIDGKYQIVRRLGQGGMGEVYEARHLGTGRRVAVKVVFGESLAENEEVIARFQREARAAGAIESQHVVQVLDTGFDPKSGHPYLVMEYLTGRDLQATLAELGPMPQELALRIVAQVCLGLIRAHGAGVVHRDIKPANVFLTRLDGGEVVAKLLDFGIAKMKMENFSAVDGMSLTRAGSLLGSPYYMSPEQAKGAKHIDARADVWSLGIVLYELLAGTTPFDAFDTLGSLIIAICSQQPPALQERAPWVGPDVAGIAHRAIAHDPAHRFQSVQEMLTAIQALLPAGHALNEGMLVPLSIDGRRLVAPKLPVVSGHPLYITPTGTLLTGGSLGSLVPGTAGGVASPRATQPARTLWPWALLVAAVVGGVSLLAGGVVERARSHAGVSTASASGPATEPVAPTLAVTASASTAEGTPPIPQDAASASASASSRPAASTSAAAVPVGTRPATSSAATAKPRADHPRDDLYGHM
jgi:serine/threonine-protein kinase